jgi:uncharacterized protein (TIGR02118 family)
MVKLSVLYGHPKDAAAFERYYLDVHTPIAQRIKGVRRFEIARVSGSPDGSRAQYHRIADLYFDNLPDMQAALASPEGQAAAADLANFATGGATLFVSEVQDVTVR